MSRNNKRGIFGKYIYIIKSRVLCALKREGIILSYRQEKRRDRINPVFRVKFPDWPREVVVKFSVLGSLERQKANFFQISMPSLPVLIDDAVIKEIKAKFVHEATIRERGVKSERLVGQALKLMRGWREIEDFYYTNETKDRSGQDIVVRFLDNEYNMVQMPLQVKSSKTGQDKHINNHPEIPSIAVRRHEDATHIARRLLDLKRAFEQGDTIHV